ncbi:MAG: hypothetical protein ACOYI3_06780 [Christensenellales bacterium]|jgi:cell division protein FtsL
MSEPKVLLNQYVYYTPTANAYKYDEPEREEKVQQSVRTAVRPAVKRKLKTSAVVSVALAALMLLGSAGVLVARYERMSAASLRISKLKSQISVIEKEIENLNIKLQYAMDINTAQIIARDKLGMDYPESSQLENVEGWANMDGEIVTASLPSYAAVPVSSAPVEGGGE